MDTKVYKGEKLKKDSSLDVQTHYKQTWTFQYTNLGSVNFSEKRGEKNAIEIDSISHLLDIHLDRGVINEGDSNCLQYSSHTPYSKMATKKLFFCLHVN